MPVDPNNICRCCGGISSPENLFNLKSRCIKLPGSNNGLHQAIDLEKWFLDFTNLDPLTYKSDYCKLCMLCEAQLLKCYEFRSSLLLAELSFATETNISLVNDEPMVIEDSSLTQDKIAKLELPPGLKLEVRKTVEIRNEDHQYESSAVNRKPKVTCGTCGVGFRTRKALAVHAKRHEQFYKCGERDCGEQFKSKSLLAHHLYQHKELAKKLVCAACGKRYESEDVFAEHQQAHNETKPVPCDDCDKFFILLQSLAHHQRTEHPKRQCKLCRRSFSAGRSLKLHMLQHAGIKFVCDTCNGIEFDDHISLLNHLKHHPNGSIDFDEDRHILIPDEIQKKMDYYEAAAYPFSCANCKKKFKTKDELQEHRKTEWCGRLADPVVTQTTNDGVVVMFDAMDEEIDYILEETVDESL